MVMIDALDAVPSSGSGFKSHWFSFQTDPGSACRVAGSWRAMTTMSFLPYSNPFIVDTSTKGITLALSPHHGHN